MDPSDGQARRDQRVVVKLTLSEARRLQAAADALGLPRSLVLRTAGLRAVAALEASTPAAAI